MSGQHRPWRSDVTTEVCAYFNTGPIKSLHLSGSFANRERDVSLFFSPPGKAPLYVMGARIFRKGPWAVVLKRKLGTRDTHPIDGPIN